jgi:cysteine desulfurase / selenocysteine lyase
MAANLSLDKRLPRLDVAAVRRDFPILATKVHGYPLVYLDSAASSQPALPVLRAVEEYETHSHANVHRGVHALSQAATAAFEGARERVRRFINAASVKEIIFVRGTTEAINLVAQSYARPRFRAGDEILITGLEHHANIVPWQMVCEQTGASLRVAPINRRGEVPFDEFLSRLGPRTRLVAFAHISNALGTVLPVKRMVEAAHQHGAVVLIDGAQAVPHSQVDVRALGADFYAFSGHKMYAPTGIGVLYGRQELLAAMPPWQGGGDMILEVTFEKTTFQEPPHRFEAGTPDISCAIGLGIALDYLEGLGRDAIFAHEEALTGYGVDVISRLPGVHLIGAGQRRLAILSVTVDGIHPHDLATILDQHKVAVRAGHHCAQPFLDVLGVGATTRASLGVYNDESDIDAFAQAIQAAQKMFKR